MRTFGTTSLFSILLILVSSFTTLNESRPLDEGETLVKWYNIEEAQALAKETPKNVFIDLTAKWCGWCKVMDKKTFSDKAVAQYINEYYYAVKVDFDSEERFNFQGEQFNAKEFAEKYNVTGLPTILFASADFKTVLPVEGYHNARQFMGKLKKFNSR